MKYHRYTYRVYCMLSLSALKTKNSFPMVPNTVIFAIFNTEFIYVHLHVTATYNREVKQIRMKIFSNSGYLIFFRVFLCLSIYTHRVPTEISCTSTVNFCKSD